MPDDRVLEASDPPVSFFARGAGRLAYVDEGPRDAPAFLTFHGIPGSVRDFRYLAPPLTREVRFVQFVHIAPKASRVTVVGDFNGWDPQATPMIRRESGVWIASVPVPPGRHVYAFVVDGDHWVADPAAPLAPEDGFGIRNSVIVVGGRESI